MSERSTGDHQPSTSRHKNREKLSTKDALVATGTSGVMTGGIAYGITRLAGAQEIADNIGIGVGGSFAAFLGGLSFGIRSSERAEELAREGNRRKALLKAAQASVEMALGSGLAGAIAGYEAKGTTGAVIGGGIGTFIGFGSIYVNKSIVEQAYKEGPLELPETPAPTYQVEQDTRFPEKVGLRKLPPVYQAASIRDMIAFRQDQLSETVRRFPAYIPLKGASPEEFFAADSSAVFILPDVQHYPAFDPEVDKKLFGLIKDPSNAMKLQDKNDYLVAYPYKNSFIVWQYPTIFQRGFEGNTPFDEEVWQAWRDRSWKHNIVLLAQYQTTSPMIPNPENTSDTYFLIDIDTEENAEKRKEPVSEVELSPVFNPQQV